MSTEPPPDDEPRDDQPIPLRAAAKLFFPRGGITASSLRTEARKGRLVITRIAGRDFVTRQAIDRMIELCTIRHKPDAPERSRPRDPHSEERLRLAQLSLDHIVKELKKPRKP
jgi:hypothetical protein